MQPIPVFRSAHLFPYLALLHEIGANVERGLRQAKLPTTLVDQTEAKLSLLHTLNFLTEMSRKEGIDDLALRAREHMKMSELSPAFLSSVFSAPTLNAAIEAYCRVAAIENTSLDVWMVPGSSEVRVCNLHRGHFDPQGSRHLDFNTNMSLVAIVRAFAGPTWRPKEMAFRSAVPLGRHALEQFPNTRFLIDQKTAWINVPRTMLSLQPREISQAPSQELQADSIAPPRDLLGTLKLLLNPYLREGYPDIKFAADIAGTSVRTLQRRLAEADKSYSNLVQHVRFEAAAQMLKDSDIKIIDITYELGYEDPSNFARAFRRIAGVSPREYRENSCVM